MDRRCKTRLSGPGAAARPAFQPASRHSIIGHAATAQRAWASTTNRWKRTPRASRWHPSKPTDPTIEPRSMPMSRTRRVIGEKDAATLLRQCGCGPIEFTGTDNAFYERHLLFDQVVDPAAAGPRERYEAAARSPRHALSAPW